MADPELSTRCAKALHALPTGRLTLTERIDLADTVDDVATFDELPAWAQAIVVEGEVGAG